MSRYHNRNNFPFPPHETTLEKVCLRKQSRKLAKGLESFTTIVSIRLEARHVQLKYN